MQKGSKIIQTYDQIEDGLRKGTFTFLDIEQLFNFEEKLSEGDKASADDLQLLLSLIKESKSCLSLDQRTLNFVRDKIKVRRVQENSADIFPNYLGSGKGYSDLTRVDFPLSLV